MPGSPRPSRASILAQLRTAARKGDRPALALAIEQMKLWALSPRYWEKYLELLAHPLARLVDLMVIKQGERIARQKGWVRNGQAARGRRNAPRKRPPERAASRPRRARRASVGVQPSLFPDAQD